MTMTIQQKLSNDVRQAMKDGNTAKRDALRMIIDVVQKKEKQDLKALDQSGVEAVITTYVKQLRESLEYAVKSDDQLKIEKLNQEIALATQYLPQQLTLDEIITIVTDAISSTDLESRNIGNIMKKISPFVKGKADGKVVNQIVKNILQ